MIGFLYEFLNPNTLKTEVSGNCVPVLDPKKNYKTSEIMDEYRVFVMTASTDKSLHFWAVSHKGGERKEDEQLIPAESTWRCRRLRRFN